MEPDHRSGRFDRVTGRGDEPVAQGQAGAAFPGCDRSHQADNIRRRRYGDLMLTKTAGLPELLDREIIGFLTAVNSKGQPQTSPIWFIRDGDDIVIYNRTRAARLRSIVGNSRVAFNLRADAGARAGVTLEGTAVVEDDLPPAKDFPGYVYKYAGEIARLGWTPDSFSADYPIGLRVTVTRVRAWSINHL